MEPLSPPSAKAPNTAQPTLGDVNESTVPPLPLSLAGQPLLPDSQKALNLFDEEAYGDCIAACETMMRSPALSQHLKVRELVLWPSATDDWHETERLRMRAEGAYLALRRLYPIGQDTKFDSALRPLRAALDSLLQLQREDMPSESQQHDKPEATTYTLGQAQGDEADHVDVGSKRGRDESIGPEREPEAQFDAEEPGLDAVRQAAADIGQEAAEKLWYRFIMGRGNPRHYRVGQSDEAQVESRNVGYVVPASRLTRPVPRRPAPTTDYRIGADTQSNLLRDDLALHDQLLQPGVLILGHGVDLGWTQSHMTAVKRDQQGSAGEVTARLAAAAAIAEVKARISDRSCKAGQSDAVRRPNTLKASDYVRHPDVKAFRQTAIRMGKQVKHRGPDWSGNHTANNTILVHERLSIVGVDTGAQPILSEDGNIALAVNGEIYNHKILRKRLHKSYPFKTHSDCEVIIPLYQEHGIDAPKYLDGMFSWVLHDKAQDRLIAARDPIGITTFYIGRSSSTPGAVYFASELKCLHPVCDQIHSFPPGHVYDSKTDQLTPYFTPEWLMEPSKVPTTPLDLTVLRETFERSVRKRLMAEVPYGVLLSGGLDSSLVAAIAQRETLRLQREYAKKQATLQSGTSTPAVNGYVNGTPPVPNNGENEEALAGIDEDYYLTDVPVLSQLNSFSIGLPGAPDSKAAQEVARYLGTKHHSFTFTIQEGLDALYDVIFHLESYDVTTIRASTPMFLLSRKIKAMGVKMVLSGEGSDEIFGGYLYFHNAPDRKAFHEETVRRVKNLHFADCLRANKSTSAWGVEARVPFLDKEFLEVAMNIDPQEKMITKDKIEKYILRKAFDSSSLPPGGKAYLPKHILWRQKEQFSDGVGYGWIDGLKDEAKKMVTDEQIKEENVRREKPHWGDDVPDSKEAYWYRCMFDEHFPPYCASTVMRWTPTWSKQTDPSGRAIASHEAAYEEGE